jgi:hypothetical protein
MTIVCSLFSLSPIFPQERIIEQPFQVSVDLVPVDVIVLDSEGNPITNLGIEDFLVWEDGVPQTIVNFVKDQVTGSSSKETVQLRPQMRHRISWPRQYKPMSTVS